MFSINRTMYVKFKKVHPNAVKPSYAKLGDAGLDITAVSINHTKNYIEYGTGIQIEIPVGHVGFLLPRSSVTTTGLLLKNSIGVIDSGFRGEMKVRFTVSLKTGVDDQPETLEKFKYEIGDRVAQLVIIPIPYITLIESDELSETERGSGGYGHTGQ